MKHRNIESLYYLKQGKITAFFADMQMKLQKFSQPRLTLKVFTTTPYS